MSPYLRTIEADANALGIPLPILKGVLFSMGAELTLVPASKTSRALQIAKRISPQIDTMQAEEAEGESLDGEFKGQNFDSSVMETLLTELAVGLGMEFEPRVITTPSGGTISSFQVPAQKRLPPLHPEITLAESADVARVLFAELGNAIEEDLEGAFLAGVWYAVSYGQVDSRSTYQQIQATVAVRPPHLDSLVRIPLLEQEELSSADAVQRAFAAFMTDDDPMLEPAVEFFNRLHAHFGGRARPEAWSGNLRTFCAFVIFQSVRFAVEEPTLEDLLIVRRELLERGFIPAPAGQSLAHAVEQITTEVRVTWGYDRELMDDYNPFAVPLCERVDLRICVIYAALRQAVLEPAWVAEGA